MPVGPDGSGGPHVYVTDLDHPALAAEDEHHLRRVLRLRDGDPLTAADGQGSWLPCVFGSSLIAAGERVQVAPAEPALTVGFALTKGAKPELVVQKLTELGIDNILPFIAERSIPRFDAAKAQKQHDRLVRVAREAGMQSRRVRLPEISPLGEFAEVAVAGAALAQSGGAPITAENHIVLVGPEGGWTAGERAGRREVGLASTVLRAETAAIAAAVLMTAACRT